MKDYFIKCFRVLLTIGAVIFYLIVAEIMSGPNDPYNPVSFGYER
jgi:hypothetical protein